MNGPGPMSRTVTGTSGQPVLAAQALCQVLDGARAGARTEHRQRLAGAPVRGRLLVDRPEALGRGGREKGGRPAAQQPGLGRPREQRRGRASRDRESLVGVEADHGERGHPGGDGGGGGIGQEGGCPQPETCLTGVAKVRAMLGQRQPAPGRSRARPRWSRPKPARPLEATFCGLLVRLGRDTETLVELGRREEVPVVPAAGLVEALVQSVLACRVGSGEGDAHLHWGGRVRRGAEQPGQPRQDVGRNRAGHPRGGGGGCCGRGGGCGGRGGQGGDAERGRGRHGRPQREVLPAANRNLRTAHCGLPTGDRSIVRPLGRNCQTGRRSILPGVGGHGLAQDVRPRSGRRRCRRRCRGRGRARRPTVRPPSPPPPASPTPSCRG